MSKIVVEDCKAISVFKLKEWGYLKKGAFRDGTITWTSSWGKKDNISFMLDMTDESDMFIKLDYRTRSPWGDGEWTDVKQKYPIVMSKCNYGGVRYWFRCSVYNSGVYCGRRVGKLFLGAGSNYFACRHCYDLIYRSSIDGYAYSMPDLDEYGEKIGRWYYNGKPTKKHIRYRKMESKVLVDWYGFIARLDNRMNKKGLK